MSDTPDLGYSENEGVVTLRLMRSDADALMMCLGCAAANPAFQRMALRLANRLNRGNPQYRPYEIPDEAIAT